MGKLIFFDIDGTIAMPGQPPGRDTVAAIRAARANGHKVFLSTGRLETIVPKDIKSIGFDGGIYSAGGRVVVNGRELLNRFMPAELVRRVTGLMTEWNLFFTLESEAGTYVGMDDHSLSYADDNLIQFLKKEMHALPRERMPEHSPVYKISFLAESQAQAGQLGEILGTTAKVVYFSSLLSDQPVVPGEISDWSINKGAGLDCICRYLKADPKDCIAFGDSLNDMEILRAAGIGIAMGNAEDCVKELTDHVCERCDEGGIAKALVRLELI